MYRTLQNIMKPTEEQFEAYQNLFDYFNRELFNGELPQCILNLSRKSNAAGFFANNRWKHKKVGTDTHEISLNPIILDEEPEYIFATLVHEMCHLWQEEYGSPSRSGYHNKEWANKMESIGLIPSTTGEPGGKKTGQQMSDYVEKDGLLDRKIKQMPKSYALPFTSVESITFKEIREARGGLSEISDGGSIMQVNKKNKIKYSCPSCQMNVWGKSDLNIKCMDCDEQLVAILMMT